MAESFETSQSAALYDRACRSLATGVSSSLRRHVTPLPLFFERADGPYFYDADGHELLDYTLGWGPLILGSNHPAINAAVARQLGRAYAFGAQHAGEAELAELIAASVPGVEQVIFSNTGTEAVQAALRIARRTGRAKVIKFEGHYHGWLNNVLVSYRPKGDDPSKAEPTTGGQPASEYADTIVLPWNDLDALERAFAKHSGKVAAVLTEPMLANSGCVMPRDGYLAGLIDLCRRHGAVSIFDEVITGFRLALGGAREFFNLDPDLSVYGKALAGGFAMSAVGGRREMFDVLRDGRTIHAGTYNGNCVNVAAAIATIGALREPGTFERMHAHGSAIRAVVEGAAGECGMQAVTSGVGTVFGLHLGVDRPPEDYRQSLRTDMATYTRLRAALLSRGVHLLPDARWYVGAAHTETELAKVAAAIQDAMREITTSTLPAGAGGRILSDSLNYETPAGSARPTMARHGVMGFLCVLAFITYFDRVCIARARPEIQRDLGLSDEQMGWVLSIFFLAYALFEIPGGWFSDRFGPRRGLARIVLAWSLFTALSGSAVGFYSLLLCRFLFGVGEAGAFPSMARVQSSWLPLRSRGMASGLLWLSARWGAAFSPLVFGLMLSGLGSSQFDNAVRAVPGLGWLADVAAWRLSFWASGLIGVVWVMVFYRWFRDDPAQSRSVNAAELALIREGLPPAAAADSGHHVDRKTWLALVSSRSIWAISILYFFVGFGFSFFITWMPKYFESEHKMAPKDTEGLSTLPLLFAGFACIAGGMTSDWIVRRTGRRRATRMTIAVSGYLIAAVSMFLIRGAESPRAAVALMCVAVFAFDFGQGSNWASIVDIGGRFAGIAAGFLNMVGNTAGFVQPVVAPYVFKNYGWDVLFALYALAFVLAAVMWIFIDPTKRFYEGRDAEESSGFPIVIEPEPLVKT